MSSSVRRLPGYAQPALLLVLFVGGALGTLMRAGLESAFVQVPPAWPLTTFAINITGAFCLAVLLESLSGLRPDAGQRTYLRVGFGSGLLGGYTTYSSFAVEVVELGRRGEPGLALTYAVSSVVVGVLAAAAGFLVVKAVRRRAGR